MPHAVNRKRRAARLATSVGAVLLSLLACEVYVRATWRGQWEIPHDVVQAPGIFSLRMKPDHESNLTTMDGTVFHVKTNARGFRGPEVRSIAGRTLRVVFLGDSFTFGWGVEFEQQGFSLFMQRYLAASSSPRDVGYASVAAPSWSPRDYYLAYLTEAADVQPDVVIVGIFTGNDVLPADTPREIDPAKVPYVDTIAVPPKAWFRSVDWLRATLSGSPFIAKLRARQAPESYAIFADDPSRQASVWAATFFHLAALDTAVRQRGGQLVIVLYPSMLQVNTPEALAGAGYNPDLPERVVGDFARSRHIPFVPVLDALRAHNGGRHLYFPRDRHLTAAGHAVTADVFVNGIGPLLDRIAATKVPGHPS